MIKFFRTIRRRLIEENSLKKYVVYAIGEILLVMIGILLALQVNNWNEKQQERTLENSYLASIKRDLQRDKEGLLEIIDVRKGQLESIEILIENFHVNESEYPSDIGNHLFSMGAWKVFNPNENTIVEIISSGNMSTIKNQGIKNDLLDLRNLYVILTHLRGHMRKEYEEYIYGTIFKIDMEPLLTEEGSNKYIRKILQIPTFKNGLYAARVNQNILITHSEKILEVVNNLLDKIDKELERGVSSVTSSI